MGTEAKKRGRPVGGGGDGRRAGWWKKYSTKPGFKEHRAAYVRRWRARKRQAALKAWAHSNEPPDNDRVVLVAVVTESDGIDVWLGFYEDETWYMVDGTPVEVKGWMERPNAP